MDGVTSVIRIFLMAFCSLFAATSSYGNFEYRMNPVSPREDRVFFGSDVLKQACWFSCYICQRGKFSTAQPIEGERMG
jgi:hypothetical protein